MTTIVNQNGRDNASCPRCKHYNAMLGEEYDAKPEESIGEICKCRDCGFIARVIAKQEG